MYGLYIYSDSIEYDLSPLRTMRILIILAKLSKKLKIMLLAITEALKFVLEASLIVLVFCIFFANTGVHLFRGQFKNRCTHLPTGVQNPDFQLCGNYPCPPGFTCFKSLSNPLIPQNLYHSHYPTS